MVGTHLPDRLLLGPAALGGEVLGKVTCRTWVWVWAGDGMVLGVYRVSFLSMSRYVFVRRF